MAKNHRTMIHMRGTLEIDTLRLSFILDQTETDARFPFQTPDGHFIEKQVFFFSVEREGVGFTVAGEITIDEQAYPIEFTGNYFESSPKTSVSYRVETELDGDDDQETAGEEWKKNL